MRSIPKGMFYTPRWVALRLVDLMLEQGQVPIDVLDPSCGAGSLLLAWAERCRKGTIQGWDTDRAAIHLAKQVLHSFVEDYDLDIRFTLAVRDLFQPGKEGGPWDGIVINPPYGTDLEPLARQFADRSSLAGREPDLFALSLLRALELLKRGKIAAIVPDVIRMQPEYCRLREELSRQPCVRRIEQLPFGTFHKAAVQPNLLILERSNHSDRKVVMSIYPGSPFPGDLDAIQRDPEHRWPMNVPALKQIWERCCERSQRLGEVARCHEGVHTGNIRHKLFTRDPTETWSRPMLKGSDVTAYGYRFSGRYIRYWNGLIDRPSGEYASLRDPALFEGPKLLSRQTSDRLVVCLDGENHVCDNTLHCIQTKDPERWPLEWLAILLNSRLATALYRFQSGEHQRPLPQIKLTLLRRLPVRQPKASLATVREIERTAKKESLTGGLSEDTIALANRLVFDCFEIGETEQKWLEVFERRQKP
ncbi:MAG: N-6 DNA methylase [Bradymonadales bacterium]|nr:N-6 DNA methylase [Bradymonadales bacterium]